MCWKYVVRYRGGTRSSGIPASSSACRSKAAASSMTVSGVIRCQAWSSSVAARYSTVANPCPHSSAAPSRATVVRRQRLAGAVVPGVPGQDLRPPLPHLVHLGRELDEVAGNVGAGEPRVAAPPRTARAARARTRGTSSGPRPGVSSTTSPGAGLVRLRLLVTTGRWPNSPFWSTKVFIQAPPRFSARAYGSSRNRPSAAAVGVDDLEDADIGVVADEVLAGRERQPVEQLRGPEDTVVQHPVEAQVVAERGGVQRVPRGLDLLGCSSSSPTARGCRSRRRRPPRRAVRPPARRWPPRPGPAVRAARRRRRANRRCCRRRRSRRGRGSRAVRPARRATGRSRMANGPLSYGGVDARATDARCTRSRRARFVSCASTGWPVGSPRASIQRPGWPASAARAAAAAMSSDVSPSSSAAESTRTAASLVAASRLCPKVAARTEISRLSSRSRSASAASRRAPARTKSRW